MIALSILGLIIVLVLDFFDEKYSYHDILVEFHGLIFDLLIFGILLTIYETIKSKNDNITRYKEEINDYKFWENEEAMFRTRGLIKRLYDLNAKNIDLSHCYLASDNSFSTYDNMKNWKFSGANLSNTMFMMSTLENAQFYSTNLKEATFVQVNLTNCSFCSAILYKTNFEKCIFTNVDISNSVVYEKNWFELLESKENIGISLLKEQFELKPNLINDIEVYRIIRKTKPTHNNS
ncbi:Pentapeptide repeat-containing protein [Lutibacter flavus]|uniref:Pentapeptide repeat-containing protein n=2 Tax=Lutibacter flavus TaxID=691689 RepID=A0A238VK00_9FLAO|nr:Pentapeptide repeat-containing protein [Lutibacter flavus]